MLAGQEVPDLDERRPAWHADAACRDHPRLPPAAWFPERGVTAEQLEVVVAVCRDCLVREECLDYALADRSLVGVWGATTGRERRQILSRRTRGRGADPKADAPSFRP